MGFRFYGFPCALFFVRDVKDFFIIGLSGGLDDIRGLND